MHCTDRCVYGRNGKCLGACACGYIHNYTMIAREEIVPLSCWVQFPADDQVCNSFEHCASLINGECSFGHCSENCGKDCIDFVSAVMAQRNFDTLMAEVAAEASSSQEFVEDCDDEYYED